MKTVTRSRAEAIHIMPAQTMSGRLNISASLPSTREAREIRSTLEREPEHEQRDDQRESLVEERQGVELMPGLP
jgi:hypothetical protein